MKKTDKKIFSITIIMLIYIVSFCIAYFIFLRLPFNNIILKFLVCDIIATFIVYLGSLLLKNSSVYDPYWSISPMIMAPFMAYNTSGFHFFNVLLILLIETWGIRLTINWLIRFKNLKCQDWRYDDIQKKHPKTWQLINLFGVHLLPTLLVFLGMLPSFAYFDSFSTINFENINITTMFSFIIGVIAIIIEMVADIQMNKFKKNINNTYKVNENGLWKNSRHPNYFGEILFWFSIFLFSLSVRNDLWVLVFCPLIIFLLFVVVSIPMLEKKQLAKKKDYESYKKRTNLLIPFFGPVTNEDNKKQNHK